MEDLGQDQKRTEVGREEEVDQIWLLIAACVPPETPVKSRYLCEITPNLHANDKEMGHYLGLKILTSLSCD